MKALYYKRVRGHCAPEIKGMWYHFSFFPFEFLRALFGINSTKPELGRDRATCLYALQPVHRMDGQLANNLSAAFAECAVNRTVTATWVCRQQRLTMNSCMLAHATREEEDRAREEWFSTYPDRRRVRDEELARVEKRREEVIRMMREDERKQKEAKER